MTAADACPRCGAALAGAVRFCTACGLALDAVVARGRAGEAAAAGTTPALDRPPDEPWFVHCPACEASNAVSRVQCGRCTADLATGELSALQVDVADDAVAPDAPDESVRAFTVVAVLAGITIVGVLATLVLVRGGELLGPEVAETSAAEPVALAGATASSALPPSGDATFEPANLIDGDVRTAWIAAASGDSAGEWVDLELAEAVPVARILLWNGYQQDDRFDDFGRVAQVRLHFDDERLTADVLDLEGPQAIDLPQPIRADRLRLELIEVVPGDRYRDVALSGVEVLAAPAP